MGGHGGLNILPQKRWNVYRYDNREKVRKDEEAAAREDQLNRQQSARRDAELRLARLRRLPSSSSAILSSPPPPSSSSAIPSSPPSPSAPDSGGHINLFHGLHGFSALLDTTTTTTKKFQDSKPEDNNNNNNNKKRKREEPPRAVDPEDAKYKLGYGLAGKGVKAPWYLSRDSSISRAAAGEERRGSTAAEGSGKKSGSGKKTIEEMREERVRRERQEKERERKLFGSAAEAGKEEARSMYFSRRRY